MTTSNEEFEENAKQYCVRKKSSCTKVIKHAGPAVQG